MGQARHLPCPFSTRRHTESQRTEGPRGPRGQNRRLPHSRSSCDLGRSSLTRQGSPSPQSGNVPRRPLARRVPLREPSPRPRVTSRCLRGGPGGSVGGGTLTPAHAAPSTRPPRKVLCELCACQDDGFLPGSLDHLNTFEFIFSFRKTKNTTFRMSFTAIPGGM